MLRRLLLAAADSDRLQALARSSRAAAPVVNRFVAGEALEDALAVVVDLNARGMAVTLDHLGEAVTDPAAADAAAQAYVAALDAIADRGLDCSLSVKLTQFGLEVDEADCRRRVAAVARRAAEVGTHVTVDMEGSALTGRTIDLVADLRAAGHDNLGCAVQAYLHRTRDDAARLAGLGASLRVCKGAYDEPAAIAHQDREAIRDNYEAIAADLLAGDTFPRFATHDHVLLHRVRTTARALGRRDDEFEVQLLHGVRTDWREALVERGLRVRVYVPFGAQWYPYLVRRLAERPANLQFFLRALASR